MGVVQIGYNDHLHNNCLFYIVLIKSAPIFFVFPIIQQNFQEKFIDDIQFCCHVFYGLVSSLITVESLLLFK